MILMPIENWGSYKATVITSKNLPLQFHMTSNSYKIFASEASSFMWTIELVKGSIEAIDFETNYMAISNKPINPQQPVFSIKTYENKKLYARNTGIQRTLVTGSNEFSYTATYPWAKVTGIEVIGGELLDYAELRVYDTPEGTYSGVPNLLLNQFGYSLNIAKDYYCRISKYDADLYAGMVMKFTYNSISNKTIGLNIFLDEVK